MKVLYINDELATGDGSNYHAIGMLCSFRRILGKGNVQSFPQAEDGSKKPVNLRVGSLKVKLKEPLQVVRYFRKKMLSVKRSKAIIADLQRKGFIPTHVIARSTVFDNTAIYVAKAFKAKLVYEINTPEYYERGIIKKEPLIGAIEKWEKKIIDASDYIYIVSVICRDMLCERHGCDKKKFLVIPNGYIEELYMETEEEKQCIRETIREREGISDKFVVTFVGSLKVWHGIKTFCEIADFMDKDDNTRFLVLGDGDMHDMIAEYTSTHKNMIFKGKVNLEVMKQYLYASDLGIMPYEKRDNFYYSPLKMFDMIGAGLPFIGTRVGQIEEFSEAYLTKDFLCDNSSTNGYIKLLNKLKDDKKAVDAMTTNVARIKNDISWEMRARELFAAIK